MTNQWALIPLIRRSSTTLSNALIYPSDSDALLVTVLKQSASQSYLQSIE